MRGFRRCGACRRRLSLLGSVRCLFSTRSRLGGRLLVRGARGFGALSRGRLGALKVLGLRIGEMFYHLLNALNLFSVKSWQTALAFVFGGGGEALWQLRHGLGSRGRWGCHRRCSSRLANERQMMRAIYVLS